MDKVIDEIKYIWRVITEKKQLKLIFRELVCFFTLKTNQWAVPREIYYLIDKYKLDEAQLLLDKQALIWGDSDLEIMRAQSYIDCCNTVVPDEDSEEDDEQDEDNLDLHLLQKDNII